MFDVYCRGFCILGRLKNTRKISYISFASNVTNLFAHRNKIAVLHGRKTTLGSSCREIEGREMGNQLYNLQIIYLVKGYQKVKILVRHIVLGLGHIKNNRRNI